MGFHDNMAEEGDLPDKQSQTSSEAGTGWFGKLAQVAAILGAFFTAGETLSAVIENHYRLQIETQKNENEIKINQERTEATLASEFLHLLFNTKETEEKDRIAVLDALSALSSHPLQQWAVKQKLVMEDADSKLLRVDREYEQATISGDQTKVAYTQVQRLEVYRDYYAHSSADRDRINQAVNAAAQHLLALQKGDQTITTAPALAIPTPAKFRLTVDMMKEIVPTFSGERAQRQAAILTGIVPSLERCMISSGFTETLVAAHVLAEVVHETAGMTTTEEYASGDAFEGRVDLGNTSPGDGRRFKGRGLIQIAGRANYSRLSQQLGLGTRLVDRPEELSDPEVAAQAACLYFQNFGKPFLNAARQDDVTTVRRMVNGGLNGLDDVRAELLRAKDVLTRAAG